MSFGFKSYPAFSFQLKPVFLEPFLFLTSAPSESMRPEKCAFSDLPLFAFLLNPVFDGVGLTGLTGLTGLLVDFALFVGFESDISISKGEIPKQVKFHSLSA